MIDDDGTRRGKGDDSTPVPGEDDAPTVHSGTGGGPPEGDDDAPTVVTGHDGDPASDDADKPTVLTGGSAPPPSPSGPAETPRRIGPYRLIETLGEGGMGEVWKALQTEPVKRKVALKIIKKGMDTREVVARFEAERQALAMMDHPCIAKVFDAGETPNGRPFFVMEYVRGIPITEHCDQRKLGMRDRLELFMQVCEGVQHAHQKAIIHRDIKPSNVLVTFQDGRALPKIIDFGVAKATSQALTEKTMYTELGQIIGTPAYMSPEQATMTGEGIDTRTDVYALGVLLYVLLAGALPFDPKELRRAGFEEIRRHIVEVDPPRPSARVTRLGGDASTESAKARGTDSRSLTSLLRGDLDWIVMRALEKDRTRRYGSPSELAADITRHLKDEPVVAGPPSAIYRAKKFVRRHKIGVGSAAAALATLVAFAVTMTLQAGRIARERDRANQEAETAREVSNFLVDLFEVSDPSEALGNTITAREILDKGAYEIRQELGDQPRVQGRLMDTMGEVYRRLGLYDAATPLMEDALEILRRDLGDDHLEVARTMEHLGTLMLRKAEYPKARLLLERALELRERQLGPDHREVASNLNNLGTLSLEMGDFETARDMYQRARDTFERASGPDHPEVARAVTNLAILYRRTGETDKARSLFEEGLAIMERAFGPDHPDVARSLNNLASLLRSTGDYEEARPLYERSLAIREKVLGPEHPDVARSLNNLANLHMATRDFRRAREEHERALAIREKVLGPEHADVAQSLNNLAIVLKSTGDYARARSFYERALGIWEAALGAEHRRVALGYYNLACLVALQQDRDEALELLREAVDRGFANVAIRDDPDLASLRGDARFELLVAEITSAAGAD